MKYTSTLALAVLGLSLFANPSHALEAVAQNSVGSGSALAASNGALNSRMDALAANQTAANAIITNLAQQVSDTQAQVKEILTLLNSPTTPGGDTNTDTTNNNTTKAPLLFGGMYQMTNNACGMVNPATNACSCPAGFNLTGTRVGRDFIWYAWDKWYDLYFCTKPNT